MGGGKNCWCTSQSHVLSSFACQRLLRLFALRAGSSCLGSHSTRTRPGNREVCWRKSNLNCSKCEISAKWPKQSAGLDLNGPKPWLEHMTRVELGAVVLVPPKWRQLADSFVRIRLPGDTYTGLHINKGAGELKTRHGRDNNLACPGLA